MIIEQAVPLRERVIERMMSWLPHDVAAQAYHRQIRECEEWDDIETADNIRFALSRLCDRAGHLPCEEAPREA